MGQWCWKMRFSCFLFLSLKQNEAKSNVSYPSVSAEWVWDWLPKKPTQKNPKTQLNSNQQMNQNPSVAPGPVGLGILLLALTPAEPEGNSGTRSLSAFTTGKIESSHLSFPTFFFPEDPSGKLLFHFFPLTTSALKLR